MSVKIMGAVFDADLPRAEKSVLLAYADHADHSGANVYPSIGFVVYKTGYSRRSVQQATRRLESRGILIADGRGPAGQNRWRINTDALPPRPAYDPNRELSPGAQPLRPHSATTAPPGAQPLRPQGRNHCAPGGATTAPKPSNKPPNKPPNKPSNNNNVVVAVDNIAYGLLKLAGIAEPAARQLAEAHPAKYALAAIWYAYTQTNLTNPAGYTLHALQTQRLDAGFVALADWYLCGNLESIHAIESALNNGFDIDLDDGAAAAARQLWAERRTFAVTPFGAGPRPAFGELVQS